MYYVDQTFRASFCMSCVLSSLWLYVYPYFSLAYVLGVVTHVLLYQYNMCKVLRRTDVKYVWIRM